MDDRWLSVDEIATYLGVKPARILLVLDERLELGAAARVGAVYQNARALQADMKKIEGRLRYKWSLTTENIELVLEDRIFKKKIAGRDAVAKAYDAAPGVLRGLGELAKSRTTSWHGHNERRRSSVGDHRQSMQGRLRGRTGITVASQCRSLISGGQRGLVRYHLPEGPPRQRSILWVIAVRCCGSFL